MCHDGIHESQQSSIWWYPYNVYSEWGSDLLKHPILSALARIERQQTIFGCDRIETNRCLLPGGEEHEENSTNVKEKVATSTCRKCL